MTRHPSTHWLFVLATIAVLSWRSTASEPDFNRDVRPILSNHCFKCHGPGTQKAGVRLDERKFALKKEAIVPGEPEASGVIERAAEPDDELRMPPPEAGDRLTAEQVEILRKWIANGAEYAPHWAFVPPVRPAVPSPACGPADHPVDAFVRLRLGQAGLAPSPEADKRTLIRRVTLDLIGLLPSPREVDDFLRDDEPGAYERVVERLLASPHYGERQARHWLDLARYADSNGYTIDGVRTIWPYRDWVIRALNDDMPFDRFTTEQLAGDLLPDANKEQLVATGFHRNTPFNEEGGADPEQFRVERTIDRANTTGAVWLGLTAACAQCHDHKFDPFTQKDYFRLYAFFNSCDEPTIAVDDATPELDQKLSAMSAEIERIYAEGGMLEEADKLKKEMVKLAGNVPITLAMKQRDDPRENYVHVRGDFLRKGDQVRPGFPATLTGGPDSPQSHPESEGLSRLDLANWLMSSENPLTARVTVNREWQKFFGKGIVESENDFGMQGSLPTHPELLDWLAVEFRESGWSMKKLHRLIVTSATYKQASMNRPECTAIDPLNKLLWRQNRLRVEAEIIRDAALSASGLLSRKMYGPGVYPPMPKEVFGLTQVKKPWPVSQGEDRYRRAIYTMIYRQSQHHLFSTFDGADAQTACTRRNRSNTPLQALHLANDPVFVELANGLGQRLLREGPDTDAGKLDHAFKLCFSRRPTDAERERVLEFLESQRAADPETAWAQVARLLINLDEFIVRE